MWKSVGCEVQGRGHKKTETPCQDKTKHWFQNDVYVIALADGAGSATLSHYGAENLVENIVVFVATNFRQLVANNDGKKVKSDIMDEINRILTQTAHTLECRLGDLASTLLLVAVCADQFLILHVGDGVIGYLEDDNLKIASSPDNGEFANVTTFVTSREALSSMRLFKGHVKNIRGFILMSDGTEQSLYHKKTKSLAMATKKLMQRTCLLNSEVIHAQLLETLNTVISKNTLDDCSIAMMVRPGGILLPFDLLNFAEQCELLQINSFDKAPKKKVFRYTKMLHLVSTPKTKEQVSRAMHINPKYIQRHLDRLILAGLIKKQGNLYSR